MGNKVILTLSNSSGETKELINYIPENYTRPAHVYEFRVGNYIEFMGLDFEHPYTEHVAIVLKDFNYTGEDITYSFLQELIANESIKIIELETLYLKE